ncbi:NAD(P)-dependent oxidoreductase [Naumannella halotolerans]|uniref:NAD(P)-dependent oxidoreductase n=1 Tax=Naumannella halotolerans TaxID=993414 RepID=UPI00370CFDD7
MLERDVAARAASGEVLLAEIDAEPAGTVTLLRPGTPQSRLAVDSEGAGWKEWVPTPSSVSAGSAALGERTRSDISRKEATAMGNPAEHEVAVLGLGVMGGGFAHNLARAGLDTVGWNRSTPTAERRAWLGITISPDVADAAAARVVLTMLPDADTTIAVLEQVVDQLPEQAIVAQMGTIGVDGTHRLADFLSGSRPDVRFVDAPVSGTRQPAEQGTVTVLASGPDAARNDPTLTRAFDAVGSRTVWLGEAGTGTRMKLVINSWLIATMEGIAETAVLADQLGFSPEEVWDVLDGGPLASPYIEGKLRKLQTGDYSTEMAMRWGAKDAQLAADAAPGLRLPALDAAREQWQHAAQADPEADIASVYTFLRADRNGR